MWPASLRFLDATFPSLAENLAADERLLNLVEESPSAATLRVWESAAYAVVVGRSNEIDREVNVAACADDAVPVVRRSSGGGAVVIGPGCLCFTLALPIPEEFSRLGIAGVTQQLMQRLAIAFSTPETTVTVEGISDLVAADRKFCGNAQRWRKAAFLHHGSLLYNFELERLSRYLRLPSRQPDYRRARGHQEFVANFSQPRDQLVTALKRCWHADA